MEGIYAFCVGILTASAVYLSLRGRTFPVVLGLILFSYAVNLFLFASGRLKINSAAVLGQSTTYTDPLPQALVLTAIVIGFAMTGFIVILAIRARADMGNDHVDGRSPDDNPHAVTKSSRLKKNKALQDSSQSATSKQREKSRQ